MSSALSEVFHGVRRDGRVAAEVVDLFGDRNCVLEFLAGVDLEFFRDRHELGALDDLRVDDVGDDRLIFAGEIFVEKFDQPCAGNLPVVPSCRTSDPLDFFDTFPPLDGTGAHASRDTVEGRTRISPAWVEGEVRCLGDTRGRGSAFRAWDRVGR